MRRARGICDSEWPVKACGGGLAAFSPWYRLHDRLRFACKLEPDIPGRVRVGGPVSQPLSLQASSPLINVNPTAVQGIGRMRCAQSFALCHGLRRPRIKRCLAPQAGLADAGAGQGFRRAQGGLPRRGRHAGRGPLPARARRDRVRPTFPRRGLNKSATALATLCTRFSAARPYAWRIGKNACPIARARAAVRAVRRRWPFGRRRPATLGAQPCGAGSGTSSPAPFPSSTIRFGSGRIRPPISSRTWGTGLDKPFYVNTANRGAALGMAADAGLAWLCAIDLRGPRGIGRAAAGPATGHSGSASTDGGSAGGRHPVAARPADGFQGMPTPSWPHGRPGNAPLGRLAGTIEEPVPSGPRD